ncbi:MAG: glycosyltransferase family 4 protein [Dehalococcoidia bacterium]|nr:glycosyltransferase family 4 protein [Dehalococcoidia bacterium]
MKIAYVFDAVYPFVKGGVERRIWEVAKRLAEKGHDVHIYGMKYWTEEDTVNREGVSLHGVCRPRELYSGGRRSIKTVLYFTSAVVGPLFRGDFDIIDCSHTPYFPCLGAQLCSTVKGPSLIVTWHEVWGDYWYEYLGSKGVFGKLIERIVSRLGDKVIAVSQSTKSDLRAIGVKGEIEIVPNGVDLEETELSSSVALPSDVIFAGRLVDIKNVDLLIRSVSRIRRLGEDLSCVVVGDGPERPRLEGLTRELGLQANIHFVGFLESRADFMSYMKMSKVMVLPSTREGFGIVVVEANACGLPVVTVDHPRNAAKDLVVAGENGFVCQLSEEDLAGKILLAIENKKAMEDMCREHARHYGWERIADQLEDVYKDALLKNGRRTSRSRTAREQTW